MQSETGMDTTQQATNNKQLDIFSKENVVFTSGVHFGWFYFLLSDFSWQL